MTESVVDLTEPVDIKKHQDGVTTRGKRGGERGLGHPSQSGPVREASQWISIHQELAPAAESVHHQGCRGDAEDSHHDRGYRGPEVSLDRESGHGPRADEYGVGDRLPQPAHHCPACRDPGVPEQVQVGVTAVGTVTQRDRYRKNRGDHQNVVDSRPHACQQQRDSQVGRAYRYREPRPQLVLPWRPGEQRENEEKEEAPGGKYDQKSSLIRERRKAHVNPHLIHNGYPRYRGRRHRIPHGITARKLLTVTL